MLYFYQRCTWCGHDRLDHVGKEKECLAYKLDLGEPCICPIFMDKE